MRHDSIPTPPELELGHSQRKDQHILKRLQKRALTLASKLDEFESLSRELSVQRGEVPLVYDKMLELFTFSSQPLS